MSRRIRPPARRLFPALLALALAVFVPVLVGTSVIGVNEADAASVQAAPGPSEPSHRSTGTTSTGEPGDDLGAAAQVAAEAPARTTSATVDQEYPYVGYLRSTITGITPTVVTATAGDLLTVTGTITNVSRGTLYDLRYVWQRGTALTGVQAIKAEITAPGRPAAVVGQDWTILGTSAGLTRPTDLAAGASLRFVASVGISDTEGLDLLQRGVFPVMIKVSGDIGQNGQTQYERIGEIHLLTTVLSLPKATGPGGAVPGRGSQTGTSQTGTSTSNPEDGSASTGETIGGSSVQSTSGSTTDIPTQGFPTTTAVDLPGAVATIGSGSGQSAPGDSTSVSPPLSAAARSNASTPVSTPTTSPTTGAPIALNLLWPLVDTPHVGVGGIFLDDNLAKEIARGGRLDNILTALASLSTGQSSTTVVIDPQLLAEVEQMAAGYRVVSTPGRPQAALTPQSATPATSTSSTTAPSTTVSTPTRPPARPTTPGRPATTAKTGTRTPTSPVATSKLVVKPTSAAAPPNRPAPTTRPVKPPVTTPPTPSTASSPTSRTPATSQPSTRQTSTTPATTPPSTTPGVTTTPTPPANTVAGTGQRAAIAFLAKLHNDLAGRQVLVLPYSDPDSVAMIRAGLGGELADLVTKGREVANSVLQTQADGPGLITGMSVPEGGMVDDATLAFLAMHGMSQALLSPKTLQHSGSAVGAVNIDERSNQGGVVTAAVTDADLLAAVNDLVARGNAAGLAVRESDLAALITGGSIDGTGTPLIVAPDNRWVPNVSGLALLSRLLRILEGGGVLTGTSLTAIAATARTPATLIYPAEAQQAELDPGYLAKVVQDRQWLAGVSRSLSRAKGDETPIPADIIDPLSEALVSTGSAALRSDQRFGHSVLRTAESTLDKLQAGVFIVGGTSYTLAASTAPLLITVTNELPYVVSVRVVIIGGEAVGLTPTDPGVLSIPAGRSQPFKIDTKVVKAGKFPVEAQLKAADGSDWSEATTITVNSSAYGVLTIVLIVVAGGALFLMVAIRIVQRIRNRTKPGDEAGQAGPTITGRPADPRPDSVLGAANEPSRSTAANPVAVMTSNQPDTQASDEDAAGPTTGDTVRPEQTGPTDGSGTSDNGESER